MTQLLRDKQAFIRKAKFGTRRKVGALYRVHFPDGTASQVRSTDADRAWATACVSLQDGEWRCHGVFNSGAEPRWSWRIERVSAERVG